MKTAKLPRIYYSFEDQLKTNPSGNVPYTPSLMLLHGLKESLAMLREEVRGGGGGEGGGGGAAGRGGQGGRARGRAGAGSCAAAGANPRAFCAPAPSLLAPLHPPPPLQGMDNVVARHHRLAEGTRKAVEGWGLELLCKHPRWQSDSLTVIAVPQGVDSNVIVKNAYAK